MTNSLVSNSSVFKQGCFVFTSKEIDIDAKLDIKEHSDKLFVMLGGAVDRATTTIPVFARWNYGKILGGSVLSVSDPTLRLDDNLNLGWWLGDSQSDYISALLNLVSSVANFLGVKDENIIFYGSSGGGFSSLVAASRLKVGRVIVINPQTVVNKYWERFVNHVAEVFDKNLSPAECLEKYPLKWSAIASVASAYAEGSDLRIVYAQNIVDKFHYDNHFLPFCLQEKADIHGGCSDSGMILTHIYDSAEGHGAEPPEIIEFFIDTGIPFLLSSSK